MYEAIEEELRQGVIIIIQREKVMWMLPIFQVPKSDGRQRKIADCSLINKFLLRRKFEMEDQKLLLQMLKEGW